MNSLDLSSEFAMKPSCCIKNKFFVPIPRVFKELHLKKLNLKQFVFKKEMTIKISKTFYRRHLWPIQFITLKSSMPTTVKIAFLLSTNMGESAKILLY